MAREKLMQAESIALQQTEAGVIAEIAASASKPVKIHEGRLHHQYVCNGERFQVPIDPPVRSHDAKSVEAMAAHANSGGAVWHTGNQVVLIVDDGPGSLRDDSIGWELTPTDAWLSASDGIIMANQKTVLRFLNGDLRNSTRHSEAAQTLIALLRSIRVKTVTDNSGEVAATSAAVGRSVSAELTGGSDLPDQITLEVQRWAELDFTESIELMITFDALEETFTIAPANDERVAVELLFQSRLNTYLAEAMPTTSVYAGRP